MWKKLLSTLLLFVICLSLSTPAFASENNLPVTTETSSERRTEISDENYKYTFTLNKKENTYTVKIQSKSTDEFISNQTFDLDKANQAFVLNKANQLVKDKFNNVGIAATYKTVKENTFSNYEYTIYYDTNGKHKWEVRHPHKNVFQWQYFQTYEVSKNRSALLDYQSYLAQINANELLIIGASVYLPQ